MDKVKVGNWQVDAAKSLYEVEIHDGLPFGRVGTVLTPYAFLISAAPEMYEALKAVLAMCENADHEPDLKEVYATTIGKIEAALNKAHGGKYEYY